MNEILEIIKQLGETSSTNDKLAILKRNKDNELFCKILKYTYDPQYKYGVSEDVLKKLLEINKPVEVFYINKDFYKVFALLDKLATNNINDSFREEIRCILLSLSPNIRELFKKVLLKDLRVGISVKTINKAIKGLIYQFDVQQAYPIEKYPLKSNTWILIEEKLNGINSAYVNGDIISRQGKLIDGLDHIKEELEQLSFKDFVFNGELIRQNTNGLSNGDNFRLTTSIVKAKDEDKSSIEMVIFDLLPREEFIQGESKLKTKERLQQLHQVKREIEEKGLKHLRIAPIFYEGTDITQVDKWLDYAEEHDMEGCMVIKNTSYKCKRHSGILKVKKFHTADCRIIGYEEGTKAFASMLGAFIIDYKGYSVNVPGGKGVTRQELIDYWNNRDSYIGKILEVSYKEETTNKKDGGLSLQFPKFLRVRDDKTEPSYN